MSKHHVYHILSVLLCLTLLCTGLISCGESSLNPANEGVLRVVCTNYAAFDLATSIIPDDASHGAIIQVLLLGQPFLTSVRQST